MRRRSLPGREAGFNIVELMVVVFIIGLLAAIAAPNMAEMVRRQRIKTSSFDVLASLTFARSEAIKRNVTVTLTSADGGTPSNWAKGWTITDANNNVLKEQGEFSSVTLAGPAAAVSFGSNGRLATAAPQFDISTYNVDAKALRCVRVDVSGRPNSKECACATVC